jgi:hypothetical protein
MDIPKTYFKRLKGMRFNGLLNLVLTCDAPRMTVPHSDTAVQLLALYRKTAPAGRTDFRLASPVVPRSVIVRMVRLGTHPLFSVVDR